MESEKIDEPGKQSQHLPRASGKFISHVFALITGNGLAQVVNILATLLLARLFAPEDFGSFALFVTLVSFLSVLGGGRYELAIMLPERDEEAANILFLAALVLLGITGFSLVGVALFPSRIAGLVGDGRVSVLLWGVPVALFVNGLYQVLGMWYGRMKRFRQLAVVRVVQSIAIVGGQLALLTVRPGGFALVGGWIIGQALSTLLLVVQLLYSDGRFLWSARNWETIRAAVGEYRNFPIYKAPYSFVANASSQLVVVIIRLFSSLNIVGFYSMAARAVYLPVSLIASSMNEVFYEKAATELKQGGLEKFVTRLLRIQVVLAAPLLVLTAFDAKLIFALFLGEKWTSAGTYAAILSFASFLYFLTSWLDRLFDIRGKQKLSLILESAGNIVSLGGLSLVLWWNPEKAVLAVGVYTVLQVLYSAIWLTFAYRIAEFNLSGLVLLLRDAIMSVAVASAVIGAIHFVIHGGPAFFASALAAGLMVGIAFSRYVSSGRAFATTVERFRQFWADKETTLNGREDEEFRHAQADELRELFPTQPRGRVLEIGCGDGSLFPYFQISVTDYKGVDFSPQFIQRFQSRQPDVRLECAEGASYIDQGSQYDLILLNGIVQHFDPAMLDQHAQNAQAMMPPDGTLIWGSVPDIRCRRQYDAGKWSGNGQMSIRRYLISWVGRIMGLDAMGYWYGRAEIAALAEKYGFRAQFVSSNLYPYRFHVVLSRDEASGAEKRDFPAKVRHQNRRLSEPIGTGR